MNDCYSAANVLASSPWASLAFSSVDSRSSSSGGLNGVIYQLQPYIKLGYYTNSLRMIWVLFMYDHCNRTDSVTK